MVGCCVDAFDERPAVGVASSLRLNFSVFEVIGSRVVVLRGGRCIPRLARRIPRGIHVDGVSVAWPGWLLLSKVKELSSLQSTGTPQIQCKYQLMSIQSSGRSYTKVSQSIVEAWWCFGKVDDFQQEGRLFNS